jgi:ribosomal protein S27AE
MWLFCFPRGEHEKRRIYDLDSVVEDSRRAGAAGDRSGGAGANGDGGTMITSSETMTVSFRALNERTCPVCGTTVLWAWHPVKHVVGENTYWHMKGRFSGKEGSILTMASILMNGKRLEA